MKIFTKNLIFFSIAFMAGAVVFRHGLSYAIGNRLHGLLWAIAGAYFLYNLLTGWFFGKRDYESLPLFDLGFRFHFAAYLIFNLVSWGWFKFGLESQFEHIGIVYTTALFWGIGLVIHFIFFLVLRKESIKGIHKEDIFE